MRDSDAVTDGTPSPANASVDAWRVPAAVDPANASADVLRDYADDAGTVNVTPRDRLVVDVTVPGLDARVANASGNASTNLTTRVLAALNESGHFAVRQTDDSTTPERNSRSLWLNATNAQAREVAGDDRYLLVVDPARVLAIATGRFDDPRVVAETYREADEDYRFHGLFEHGLSAYEVYTARYYVNDSVRGLAATSGRVKFRPAHATVAADGPLEPDENATVTGTTNVAPGTELALTARTDAGAVTTAVVTVADRGRYDATLDLALVDAPASVNVSVALAANRSHVLTDAPATIAVRDARAAVAFDDQSTSTRYVSARANLSHGGFLALEHDGDVVDATTVLDAGIEQTVTFRLPENATAGTYTVVAYRGSASDPGERYANATADATIAFANDTTTTPPTTMPTTTYDETPILGNDTTTTGTTGITTGPWTTPGGTSIADDPIPGFGVPVALAALAALLGVVASRRYREN